MGKCREKIYIHKNLSYGYYTELARQVRVTCPLVEKTNHSTVHRDIKFPNARVILSLIVLTHGFAV